jgi:hypothetical protein
MEWQLRFAWEVVDVRQTARGRTTAYRESGRYTGWIQCHVAGLGWQPARERIPDRTAAEARCAELNERER